MAEVHRLPLKPRAQQVYDTFRSAGDFRPVISHRYAVKGLFEQGAISLVFGPPGTGKTALMLDACRAVSRGEDWMGQRVRRGLCIYFYAEGAGKFANRVCALGETDIELGRLPFSLLADFAPGSVAEAVIARAGGRPVSLIVIDTLAHAMAGADENNVSDIMRVVRALGAIRDATGAHLSVVHHTGKNTAMGARGNSALHAAVDVQLELSRAKDSDDRLAVVTKNRDGADGLELPYRLIPVNLATDDDGDPVTACKVRPIEGGANA